MGNIVQKIHHTGITVKNLEESIKFYEEVFGFKLIGGVDLDVDAEGIMKGVKIKIAFLKAGEDDLELLEYVQSKDKKIVDMNPWDPGVQHLSFKVTDVRGFYKKHKNWITFLVPPVDFKTKEIDTTWTYLKDPNGTLLELSEDHKERVFQESEL